MTRATLIGLVASFAFAAIPATAGASTWHCGERHWRKGPVIATYEELQITLLPGSELMRANHHHSYAVWDRFLCKDALGVAEEAQVAEEGEESVHLNFTDALGHYHCTYKPLESSVSSVWDFTCTVHGRFANRVSFQSLLQSV